MKIHPWRKKGLAWMLTLTMLAIACIGAGCSSKPVDQEPCYIAQVVEDDVFSNAEGINKSKYDSLELGMTYQEVSETIGQGTIISQNEEVVIYQYLGESGYGANAELVFRDNKLIDKNEMGLK